MQNDVLVWDWETTISNKGNPFDQTNKAVLLVTNQGHKWDNYEDYSTVFKDTALAVGFNCKFDLHWNRRCGLPWPSRIWDCQLAEFILSNQTIPYPSLDGVAEIYKLGTKIDVVRTEYWENGIDTDQVPQDILLEYGQRDIELTYQVYLKQKERFETTEKHKYRLFQMCCADLLELAEMEWNGLLFDSETAAVKSKEAKEKLHALRCDILGDYASLPINMGSGDHLSAFLYGGTITESLRVPNGVYRTGAKTGMVRYQIIKNEFHFPRKFEPLEKSALKKEGYWSTDEQTLRSLKGTKEQKKILALLDEYAKLDKLNGTYYEGLSSLITEMNWKHNELHGQFNQVVARTGRLSASQPNQQNFSPECKKLLYSRYN
jgi:DNA polymerase I-like protein with 3'-5' exonuclease and polymerase domains